MSHMELPDQVSPSQGPGFPWANPNAAAAISAFVDQGPFGVAVVDTDLRLLLVSQGLATLHGQDASQTVGKRIEEVLPPPYGIRVGRRLRETLRSGRPRLDGEAWGTFADPGAERSFSYSYYRLDDALGVPLGVIVLVTETTDLRKAAASAISANAQLELLHQVTEALSGSGDVAGVTEVALRGAAQAVGASAAALMALGADETLVCAASGGLMDTTMARLQETAVLDAHLPHCETLRSRTITLWGSRAQRDVECPSLAGCPAEHQAWAFVPLLAQDRGIGVIIFAWRLDREFDETDVSLLGAVGRQCALALEQARILEAERDARRAMEFLVEVTKFVVEGSDAGVFAMSSRHRILTFNRRLCDLLGLVESDIKVGAESREFLDYWATLAADPDTMARHLAAVRERPLDPLAVDFETKDGRILVCNSSPILNRQNNALGRVWYIRDDTERLAQENAQRNALQQLRASHEHQAFLLQASEIVSRGDGYGDTLERLAAVAVPTLADLCLVDALTWDGRVVRMAARHADPALQALVDELGAKYAPDPAGTHPSIEVMQTGRVRWSETMSDDFLRETTRDDRHFTILKRLGFTSYMALPLVADNRILGSITLVSAGSGRRFGYEDLALAADFTSSVAQVVAAAHRNDSARHAAHTLQASLLPDHVPDVPGLSLAVRYLPATIDDDVGGDFYDVITRSSGVTTITIGDVAGHDMHAAAIMGKVRTAVRVLAAQASGPRHFIEMLRRGWDHLELDRMATLLVANVDAGTGELRIVSAGHPPPLLVADGGAQFLEVTPTAPLGAPPSPIQEWCGSLAEGETLLFFTDGLVEDRHRNFQDGSARLVDAAAGGGSPEELCDRVLGRLVDEDFHHEDDIALVAVAREAAVD